MRKMPPHTRNFVEAARPQGGAAWIQASKRTLAATGRLLFRTIRESAPRAQIRRRLLQVTLCSAKGTGPLQVGAYSLPRPIRPLRSVPTEIYTHTYRKEMGLPRTSTSSFHTRPILRRRFDRNQAPATSIGLKMRWTTNHKAFRVRCQPNIP